MRGALMVVAAASLANSTPLLAQFPPDSVVNLKVLSKDMTPREVIRVMRGFALGLGVRCEHCHMGEAGQPLSTFDFAADDKPTKVKARDMLRMVMAINGEHLAKLADRSDPPLEVTCATCHHGLNRPITLEDELMQVYGDDGVDGAIAHYRDLRERYYGSWSYDFGELTLSFVASRIAQAEDYDGAIAMLDLNREYFPASAMIYLGLAQMYDRKGDRDTALRYLERSLELNPENPVARRLLQAWKGNGSAM